MPLKPKKKAAVRPRKLSLDERLDRLARQAEADRDRAVEMTKQALADRDRDRERMAAMTKRAEADRDRDRERMAAMTKQAEADRAHDRERMAAMTKRAEADRDRAKADRDREHEHLVEMTKRAEADRDQAMIERDRSLADRDRLARLEEKVVVDHKNNQGHRSRLSRALEDAFAASLPRAMRAARGIVVKPEDVRVRVRRRKGGVEQEFDFIAPNGELVLAGEVKTHLTLRDVENLTGRLVRFRLMFPEYAGLPVHGVVAGGEIDENASRLACDSGFVILRLEGAEVHPVTAGADYRLKAY